MFDVGELAAANNGSNFRWSANTEERNKLWKARHMFYYAGKALIPNCRVRCTGLALIPN